jgi:hypothetical protein
MPVLTQNGRLTPAGRARESIPPTSLVPRYSGHELPMLIVLPFCRADHWLALKNLEWAETLQRMDPAMGLDGPFDPLPFECLLAADEHTPVSAVERQARRVFQSVELFRYAHPARNTWPQGSNWMFVNVARRIALIERRPWLLWETDAVPLTSRWLEAIQLEYRTAGQPFMGAIVDIARRHMNGQGCYPPDVATWTSRAFSPAAGEAWDTAMAAETLPHTHAANHLLHNVWLEDGRYVPTFPTQREVEQLIPPGAVLFHRCKDGTLIDRLRERLTLES